jgi:hypothetical protein
VFSSYAPAPSLRISTVISRGLRRAEDVESSLASGNLQTAADSELLTHSRCGLSFTSQMPPANMRMTARLAFRGIRPAQGNHPFGVLSLRHFGWSFYPLARGTDESGAAKFLLDLLGPPDGEVAAACRCRFLFSDYDWRWRSGGGVMVPAPARGRGSNWRRPDRDNWAVAQLSVRHFRCRLARARGAPIPGSSEAERPARAAWSAPRLLATSSSSF